MTLEDSTYYLVDIEETTPWRGFFIRFIFIINTEIASRTSSQQLKINFRTDLNQKKKQ